MVRNNIDELLLKQGKTRYWLAKEINVTYTTLFNLANNSTTSIKLELLEKLCTALDCTLNDLFTFENNK